MKTRKCCLCGGPASEAEPSRCADPFCGAATRVVNDTSPTELQKSKTPRTDAVEKNFGEMPGEMRKMELELSTRDETIERLERELAEWKEAHTAVKLMWDTESDALHQRVGELEAQRNKANEDCAGAYLALDDARKEIRRLVDLSSTQPHTT